MLCLSTTKRTSHAPNRDLAEEPKATKSSWKEYAPSESGRKRRDGEGAAVSFWLLCLIQELQLVI